jgi:hypothetical protein
LDINGLALVGTGPSRSVRLSTAAAAAPKLLDEASHFVEPGSRVAAEHPMSEAWCAFGDGVVYVLPAVPGLWVDRFEGVRVLGGIAIGWEKRGTSEEGVDPVNPDLVAGVDFTCGEVVLAAEDFRLEVPDHGVASRNPRGGGCTCAEKSGD